MSRYIDAEKLGIGTARPEAFVRPEYATGWNSAIEIIKNAPTADVVEVVRCKDCKCYELMKSNNKHYRKRLLQSWREKKARLKKNVTGRSN